MPVVGAETMMRTVDELEEAGLAVRQAVPGDRRARGPSPSPTPAAGG